MSRTSLIAILLLAALAAIPARAQQRLLSVAPMTAELAAPDTSSFAIIRAHNSKPAHISIYDLPYSMTTNSPDWKRVWINAGIFTGAFCSTLAVLECLPQDATNWNRATIQSTPWYKRWDNNVLKKGPEWDGDDLVFNYIMHPYAGAVYFMAARSAGLNFYRSLLFCSIISTVGWEFGIEGTMERPSIQDIFITPLVGSVIGELFYHTKRYIIDNDYRLLGSKVLGYAVAVIVDPVNAVVDVFAGWPKGHNSHKTRGLTSSLVPTITPDSFALTLSCTF